MKTLKTCLLAVACLAFVLQGCGFLIGAGAGAAAGAAGTKYVQGSLDTTYPVGLQQAVKASQNAMQQSQIQITDTRMDSTMAEITGTRTSDGAPVTVKLKPLGPNSTHAEIRVGKLGDENAARVLNRLIFEGLK